MAMIMISLLRDTGYWLEVGFTESTRKYIISLLTTLAAAADEMFTNDATTAPKLRIYVATLLPS